MWLTHEANPMLYNPGDAFKLFESPMDAFNHATARGFVNPFVKTHEDLAQYVPAGAAVRGGTPLLTIVNLEVKASSLAPVEAKPAEEPKEPFLPQVVQDQLSIVSMLQDDEQPIKEKLKLLPANVLARIAQQDDLVAAIMKCRGAEGKGEISITDHQE